MNEALNRIIREEVEKMLSEYIDNDDMIGTIDPDANYGLITPAEQG